MAKLTWLGHAQHFCAAGSCRFHMATLIEGPAGRYVVSTVGDYFPEHIKGRHPQKIGCDRTHETYVFRAVDDVNSCGCPVIDDFGEIDSLGCNDSAQAQAIHMEMVEKWSRVAEAGEHHLAEAEREEGADG